MPPADTQIEFLGQSLWWAAVGALVGAALLVYAILLWQERRRAVVQAAGARGPATSERAASVFGAPLWLAAGLGGLVVLAVSSTMAYQGWDRGRSATAAWPPSAWAMAMAWLLATASGAVWLFYRRVYGYLNRFRRWCLVALRVAGMAALTVLLFRPVLAFVQGAGEKPVVAIVIDASASMGYNDAPNEPNRFRQAAIAVQSTLTPRLEKVYQLQVYAYDGRHTEALSDVEELDRIVPDAPVTDLGAAIGLGLGGAGTSKSGGGERQVVLFSDGIHNGPTSVEAELADMAKAVPVHTVRVGSSDMEPSSVPDIAVVGVDGPQTAVVNNQVTLTASIKSTAMSDRTVRVMLSVAGGQLSVAGGGRPLDEQRLVLRSGSTPQTVPLKFTPDKVGRMVVRVQVPVDPGERSDVNNQQDFALLVTDPKLTVLYVEGRVRPEVGPLRRALEQDPNLSAVSLVQTSAGRFEMTGVKTGDDLKGLPTTAAQWKRFKVVILGDLDSSFLSSQQQRDLEQTVRDGAGLLMIGGQNSFAPGGWGKTTLSALLPVSLDKVDPAQINAAFVPQLTAIGAAHPILRNIAGYFIAPDGRKGATVVPELSGCVALGPAKAGASVLAVHPTQKIGGEPAIVLAVQQYGKGRTAAFAADTTFRWNLVLRGMGKDSPYNRFWGQMVRWLASQEDLQKKTGASVTAMLARERFDAGETVHLGAAVTDKDGQATNFAATVADITGPDGKTVRTPMSAKEEGQIGMYEATYKPTMAGTYKVTFSATKDNGALGKDETNFLVMPAAGERDVLAAQPKTLESIAAATHGSSIDLPAVAALADQLLAGAPQSAQATRSVVPLYHARGFFFLFVACIGVEWLLRRRWQLQ